MAKKKDGPVYLDEMVWKPGVGPDFSRLRELMGWFGKPSIPLGEAWFLGETRHLDDELNADGIDAVSNQYVGAALDELISGLVYFHDLPDWALWYAYLMPRILGGERFIIGELNTSWFAGWYEALGIGVIALCRFGTEESVLSHRVDFVEVLSPWAMSDFFWDNGRNIPLWKNQEWRTSWGSSGLEPNISLALLLTWVNLAPSALRAWVRSVVEIEDALWRAHFVYWLLKVLPAFERNASNSELLELQSIYRHWSVAGLDSILISAENIAAMKVAIREEIDEGRYLGMIEQFSAHPDLWPQMESALGELQEKYL